MRGQLLNFLKLGRTGDQWSWLRESSELSSRQKRGEMSSILRKMMGSTLLRRWWSFRHGKWKWWKLLWATFGMITAMRLLWWSSLALVEFSLSAFFHHRCSPTNMQLPEPSKENNTGEQKSYSSSNTIIHFYNFFVPFHFSHLHKYISILPFPGCECILSDEDCIFLGLDDSLQEAKYVRFSMPVCNLYPWWLV